MIPRQDIPDRFEAFVFSGAWTILVSGYMWFSHSPPLEISAMEVSAGGHKPGVDI